MCCLPIYVAFRETVEPGSTVTRGEKLPLASIPNVTGDFGVLPRNVAFGQHPRAVDTQDATVQVITPCYAWGEAWVA